MPPASKRKRGGGKAGPKSKRGKKVITKELISSESEKDEGDKDGDDDEGGEPEWVVESVVDKRTTSAGKVEYFLKWKNWPSSTNTWEPQEHLNCSDLVQAYEDSLLPKEDLDERPNGFDDGLTTRAVRGIVNLNKNGRKVLHYLIEWEDTDRIEPVPASVVREKIPQEVIKFLVKKIKWKPPGERIERRRFQRNTSPLNITSNSEHKSDEEEEDDDYRNKKIKATEPDDEDDD